MITGALSWLAAARRPIVRDPDAAAAELGAPLVGQVADRSTAAGYDLISTNLAAVGTRGVVVLTGSFDGSSYSEIAASLGVEVAALLASTIGRLCEGQIEELRHTYNAARPEGSYLASIAGKTASLYATSARIGGIVEIERDGKPEEFPAHGLVDAGERLIQGHQPWSGGSGAVVVRCSSCKQREVEGDGLFSA